MEEIPIAAGLQIIDAHNLKEGRMRERINSDEAESETSRGRIDKAFIDIRNVGKDYS